MAIELLDQIDQRKSAVTVDDPPLFEIVDGEVVELSEMSTYSHKIANRIHRKIAAFLELNDLGDVDQECLFRLALPKDRNRRPDVSFVSYQRWPKERPYPYRGNAQDVVPDLAVEVVSPGDPSEELNKKIDEYFRSGVQLVWVVHPITRVVTVYTSLIDDRSIPETGNLDGGDVLPGFQVKVADLFPPMIQPDSLPSDE